MVPSSSLWHPAAMPWRMLSAAVVCVAAATSASVSAQTPQDGRLIVTVVDASNAVVPGATVTISGLDDGARAPAFPPVTSSDKGVVRCGSPGSS